MIPEDVISQIRDAADIVQVIGQHVQLRRAGRNWKGLCPFHGEKTPSFSVSPDKGFFHCFGCQKHGDVFDFVMELEGKSFVDAAEELAGRFGIAVPRIEENPELRRMRGERVAMLELNKLATQFYREVLADPARGEAGKAYLAKRGVSDETAAKFQLGYAPGEWGALADFLKSKRADLELAVKVGLLAHRPRSGGYYDRNRDRLVCPVVVPGGDVVGFSSRVVGVSQPAPDGSEPPKYINSPESAVYKKSKLLFGLAQAREAMAVTKRAVLVEGNFDVITLHQAGFTDVIAPLGTALTPEQIGVLKRLVERVVLLYDGDRAGYKATMHALQMCVEQEVDVLIASSPGHGKSGGLSGPLADGVDPDSLVAGGGAELLREAIDRARGGIEFFAFEVWSKARNNLDARARALDDAARLVAKVGNPMKRDLIVGTLATGMEIDPNVVRNALARASGGSGYGQNAPRPAGQFQGGRPGSHPNGPDDGRGGQARGVEGSSTNPAAATLPPHHEVEVITLLADHPSLIATVDADKAFWLLTDARLQAMYSAARAGQSLHELAGSSGQLPPPTIVHVLSGKYAASKDPRADLIAMTRNLELRKAGVGSAELKKDLALARRKGDRELERKLAQLAVAERKGDHELAAQLRASIAADDSVRAVTIDSEPETSHGKQVD
jgi:DNA primase